MEQSMITGSMLLGENIMVQTVSFSERNGG